MRQRLATTVGVVLAVMVAFAGAAVASEVVEEVTDGSDDTLTVTDVDAEWIDDAGGIIISIGEDAEGTSPCDGVTLMREDDELVVLVDGEPLGPEAELQDGCYVFDGTRSDGKINHGTMVSIVARSLSPHDLDVPKGWIMREVAKERPTKVKAAKDDSGGDDDGDDDDATDDDDKAPKDKAAKDKAAKDKAAKADKVKKDKPDKARGRDK